MKKVLTMVIAVSAIVAANSAMSFHWNDVNRGPGYNINHTNATRPTKAVQMGDPTVPGFKTRPNNSNSNANLSWERLDQLNQPVSLGPF